MNLLNINVLQVPPSFVETIDQNMAHKDLVVRMRRHQHSDNHLSKKRLTIKYI